MVTKVLLNGVSTPVPGIYGLPQYAPPNEGTPRGKILAIVGDFPQLVTDEPAVFSSQRAFLDFFGDDPDFNLFASIAWRPDADPRLGGSPPVVILANTYSSVRAALSLVDTTGAASVRLTAVKAGQRGNLLSALLGPQNPAALAEFIVNVPGGTSKTFTNVGTGKLLTLSTNSVFLDFATAGLAGALRAPLFKAGSADPVGEFDAVWWRSALPSNASYSPEPAVSGPIIFSADGEPVAAIEITVSGINKATGLSDSEVVTLPAASSPSIATVKSFFGAVTIAVGAGSTAVNVIAPSVQISSAMARTAGELANVLNDMPSYLVTVNSPQISTIPIAECDPTPSAVDPVTQAFTRALVGAINFDGTTITAERLLPTTAPADSQATAVTAAGTTVTVADTTGMVAGAYATLGIIGAGSVFYPLWTFQIDSVTDGTTLEAAAAIPFGLSGLGAALSIRYYPPTALVGPPVSALSPLFFTGGSEGTLVNRDAAIEALRPLAPSVVCGFEESPAMRNSALANCLHMAGAGAGECNAWVPIGVSEATTRSGLKALNVELNSRHISTVLPQEILVRTPGGDRRWLSPRWEALMFAAAQASVVIGRPLTDKLFRVLAVRQASAFNPDKFAGDLIDAGSVFLRQDPDGFRLVRSRTTHMINSAVALAEVSSNESVYWSIRDMRSFLRFLVGENSTEVAPGSLRTLAIQRLRLQRANKVIADFVEDSVKLVISNSGDITRVMYRMTPLVGRNFVVLSPYVETVDFEVTA